MVSLDAVGNTTKAVTRASPSLRRHRRGGAVRQLHRDRGRRGHDPRRLRSAKKTAGGVFALVPINVADPKVFIGLLIGGAVPFLFSSLAIRAVAAPLVWSSRRSAASSPTARS